MNRRTVLAGGAAVLASSLNGCTGILDEEPEGVTLTQVELGSASDRPQVFDLLVTVDGEVIHWASHKVDAGGEEVIDIGSPDERGHVDVFVRVGEEWKRSDLDTDRYDGERVIAVVTYGMVEDDLLRISRVVSDRSSAD